ncbi:exodeoxyribonuclease V subunit gamma [Rodentibacter caecimuris]|uniref:RecBCD enzyme subunit RecC n=1 Tax=Rodentibacter caecimuris TaxID=1796644 RepID=A0ABX3KZ32_9PAST|nr:exodeoxyribonuclease V subunit gamma [Rodentibacter heylii]
MFITYSSNYLENHLNILSDLLTNSPPKDPFQSETILVQSPGMAQWLQMELAKQQNITANLHFPMPASFIWQLYADNLPHLSKQNVFDKELLKWRLMRLIPSLISQEEFTPLARYLHSSPQSEQQKLYQLSVQIADLFDQYLVYRPDWIQYWQEEQVEEFNKIFHVYHNEESLFSTSIQQHIRWQSILWKTLINNIEQDMPQELQHRATLNRQFIEKLDNTESTLILPERIFICGISALPEVYFETLQALSKHCQIYLFFLNPCEEYWGDIRDTDQLWLERLKTLIRKNHHSQLVRPFLSEKQHAQLTKNQTISNYDDEQLIVGHPLLASWGKLGRDFFYQLIDKQDNVSGEYIDNYHTPGESSLLQQVQSRILTLSNEPLHLIEQDNSINFHSCHSPMRELEVLKDYLLNLFNQNPHLPSEKQITPKDIVVMVADINQYAPYIRAVFAQNEHKDMQIPFSISDNKTTESDAFIAAYISLLQLKESQFSAEDILALLDIPAIRERFNIQLDDLIQIRYWVADSGIRFGLEKYPTTHITAAQNYNSWQSGLERMILGYALREEHGIWQNSLGLDNSYGLKGQLVGHLAEFLDKLYHWHQCLQHEYLPEKWHLILSTLLTDFFIQNEENLARILFIQDCINQFLNNLQQTKLDLMLSIDVVSEAIESYLDNSPNTLKFLAGKVNFCTLLPMRAIPFKIVCLLGMNEGDYPRTQTVNHFDLMQYHHRKGDRIRRNDDRYLFLEALLSARNALYISYVGRSIIDNQTKEPSVLVSQLLDYLNENVIDRKIQIKQHPMSPFNPQNFSEKDYSFAAQWLPLSSHTKPIQQEFIQDLANQIDQSPLEIDLQDLVSFVENPVKFFFEKQLGVYFQQYDDTIEDSENFSLDGLTAYQISNELLHLEESQFEQYFEQLMIKGLLPRGEFGKIYTEKLRLDCLNFKQRIAEYQTPHSLNIDCQINTVFGTVRLFGRIDQLFSESHQYVTWYLAKDKTRYRIRPWIYYLVLLLTQESVTPPLLIVKDKTKSISFKSIEKNVAEHQLQRYVEDYLKGKQRIQPVPTENIKVFLPSEESAVDFERILSAFEQIKLSNGRTKYIDPYWQRLLIQTELSKSLIEQISEQTQAWFALMMK